MAEPLFDRLDVCSGFDEQPGGRVAQAMERQSVELGSRHGWDEHSCTKGRSTQQSALGRHEYPRTPVLRRFAGGAVAVGARAGTVCLTSDLERRAVGE